MTSQDQLGKNLRRKRRKRWQRQRRVVSSVRLHKSCQDFSFRFGTLPAEFWAAVRFDDDVDVDIVFDRVRSIDDRRRRESLSTSSTHPSGMNSTQQTWGAREKGRGSACAYALAGFSAKFVPSRFGEGGDRLSSLAR